MGLYSIHRRYRDPRRETTGLFEWQGFVDGDNLQQAVNKTVHGEARTYRPEVGDVLFIKPTTQRGDSGGQGQLLQVTQPEPPLSWRGV